MDFSDIKQHFCARTVGGHDYEIITINPREEKPLVVVVNTTGTRWAVMYMSWDGTCDINTSTKFNLIPNGRRKLKHTTLELQPLRSDAGWYLGTADNGGPLSRESVEFWDSKQSAQWAMDTNEWTKRRSE